MAQYSGKIWVLASEFSGLNSSFQGLKFVGWWGTAPMKEMLKNDVDKSLDIV